MKRSSLFVAALGLAAAGAASAQTVILQPRTEVPLRMEQPSANPPTVLVPVPARVVTPGEVVSRQPMDTQAMAKLRDAAQRLRESIQAMATNRTPGMQRDRAIMEAHEALFETQRAMLALPPELRSYGTVSTGDYDQSVRKLMAAADALRQSIQEMAQQPVGPGRNNAIRQANQALWDTQTAMALAYQPDRTAAMGASRVLVVPTR